MENAKKSAEETRRIERIPWGDIAPLAECPFCGDLGVIAGVSERSFTPRYECAKCRGDFISPRKR